jgi:hypothetical protein
VAERRTGSGRRLIDARRAPFIRRLPPFIVRAGQSCREDARPHRTGSQSSRIAGGFGFAVATLPAALCVARFFAHDDDLRGLSIGANLVLGAVGIGFGLTVGEPITRIPAVVLASLDIVCDPARLSARYRRLATTTKRHPPAPVDPSRFVLTTPTPQQEVA